MVCYGRAYRTLSKMNIRSCFIPDDTIISQRQLISNTALWPNLRELDFNSVSGLTLKTGLFVFLDACPVLEKLTFKNVPWWHVTDATLDRWTDHYPRLMDIRYFCQPDDITQTAVKRLAETKYTIIRQREQHNNNRNNNNNFVHLEFNTHTRIHISFPI
ncbi:hypothetical protein BDC45DRAFT_510497 [Circinella umbellata]|nr:hypothetical protein BDC45DRAFT_510497 [Circinella umbellata]